jgi:hypothetical protein
LQASTLSAAEARDFGFVQNRKAQLADDGEAAGRNTGHPEVCDGSDNLKFRRTGRTTRVSFGETALFEVHFHAAHDLAS